MVVEKVPFCAQWINCAYGSFPQLELILQNLLQNGLSTLIVITKMNVNNTRIYRMSFASVYPHYIQKADKKDRTKSEVDELIFWLTGYNQQALQQHIDHKTDFETFFAQAPLINPNASKITGVICGYRAEEIQGNLMRKIRYLDKLIDELAKGDGENLT